MLRYFAKSCAAGRLTVVICLRRLSRRALGDRPDGVPVPGQRQPGRDDDGKVIGSRLIAQPFTKDEYFQPRPSAASYNAAASASSSYAAVELPAARPRGRALGPIVEVRRRATRRASSSRPTSKPGSRRTSIGGNPHIVAQWADAHNSLAQGWVKADPTHAAYVDAWAKAHRRRRSQMDQGQSRHAAAEGHGPRRRLLRELLERASRHVPLAGDARRERTARRRPKSSRSRTGTDIQSIFFDMWRAGASRRRAATTCPAIW